MAGHFGVMPLQDIPHPSPAPVLSPEAFFVLFSLPAFSSPWPSWINVYICAWHQGSLSSLAPLKSGWPAWDTFLIQRIREEWRQWLPAGRAGEGEASDPPSPRTKWGQSWPQTKHLYEAVELSLQQYPKKLPSPGVIWMKLPQPAWHLSSLP